MIPLLSRSRVRVALVGVLAVSLLGMSAGSGSAASLPTAETPGSEWKYGTPVFFEGKQGFNVGPIEVGVRCKGQAYWVAKRDVALGLIRYGMKYQASTCSIQRPGNPPNKGDVQGWQVRGTSDSASGFGQSGGTARITRVDVSGLDNIVPNWSEASEIAWLGYEADPSAATSAPIPGLQPNVIYPTEFGHVGGWWVDNISLGPKPTFGVSEVPNNCQFGKPGKTTVTKYITGTAPAVPNENFLIDQAFYEGMLGQWTMYVVIHDGTNYSVQVKIATPNPQTGQTVINMGPYGYSTNSAPRRIVGVQVFRNATGPSPATPEYNVTGATASYGAVTGSSTKTYGLGRTIPSKCMYWISGEKLFSNTTDDEDEPYQAPTSVGLDVEPAEIPPGSDPIPNDPPISAPDEACNFDIGDPSSWISGSACALVGLLGKLIDLLVSILMALIGLPAALIDYITQFFNPDLAILSAHTATLRDSFSQSAIGTYASDVGGVVSAFSVAEGGCSGPSVTLPLGGTGGTTIKPLSSCGSMSGPASVVRAAITLVIWLGVALVSVRLVSASLGLNVEGFGRDTN